MKELSFILICTEKKNWVFQKRKREMGGEGLSRIREKKIYQRLVNVNIIRPATSAGWQLVKLRFYPPTETGLPDDCISEEWLSDP